MARSGFPEGDCALLRRYGRERKALALDSWKKRRRAWPGRIRGIGRHSQKTKKGRRCAAVDSAREESVVLISKKKKG